MKRLLLPFTLFLLTAIPSLGQSKTNAISADSAAAVIKQLYAEALTNEQGYKWLDHLCNQIGARMSGSENAAKAVAFVKGELQQLKNATVSLQACSVPVWERGEKESAFFKTKGNKTSVNICALGGSIATPEEGIGGDVVMVRDFEEIKALGPAKLKDKIVFMNHPMEAWHINPFEAYGKSARYRWLTASKAAAQGAKAVVIRSMNISLDDYPHTGSMGYNDSFPKIPACAISTNDAEKLALAITSDPKTQFWYKQSCVKKADAPSYNVIAEIRGTEFPDEYIVVGGHLDSWDLAQGAHDDGTGVVQSMEVIRLFNSLNIRPKRSIRCVAFMNEEYGGRGGEAYAANAKTKKEKNIAAIESDGGGFTPRGFSFNGDSAKISRLLLWSKFFEPYHCHEWKPGYGGADIDHLEDQGTMLIGYNCDSQRYFDIHHSALDTFDRVNHRELQLGAASMAALVFLLSEYGVE